MDYQINNLLQAIKNEKLTQEEGFQLLSEYLAVMKKIDAIARVDQPPLTGASGLNDAQVIIKGAVKQAMQEIEDEKKQPDKTEEQVQAEESSEQQA